MPLPPLPLLLSPFGRIVPRDLMLLAVGLCLLLAAFASVALIRPPAPMSGSLAGPFNTAAVAQPAIVAAIPAPTSKPGPKTAPAATTDGPETQVTAIARGDTLGGLLEKMLVSSKEAQQAITALRSAYDPRRLRAGQEITLHLGQAGSDGSRSLLGLEFRPDALRQIAIARAGDTFQVEAREIPVVHRTQAISGTIDGSLFESARTAGVPMSVMAELVRAFSTDVDFQRDVQAGDRFSLLFEQGVTPDGAATGQSKVLYAALTLSGKEKSLYRVRLPDGNYDYFDAHGQSLRRQLLRTPVDGARMSSGFGMRRHPILGYSKMHRGIDFAAPTGTPILAAGDGVIEIARYNGSYGRYIRIRHNGTYATAYAHLSRFASSISPGTRVRQGQVIGYVGSTGRSTGPHLHYEVLVNGRQANPLSIKLPTGRNLKGRELDMFLEARQGIDRQFRDLLAGVTQVAVAN